MSWLALLVLLSLLLHSWFITPVHDLVVALLGFPWWAWAGLATGLWLLAG